jgi:hypothetical protein
MGGEQPLHGGALKPFAAAVDHAHDLEAGTLRLVQILFHDRDDLGRRKPVQVDRVLDGNVNRIVLRHGLA